MSAIKNTVVKAPLRIKRPAVCHKPKGDKIIVVCVPTFGKPYINTEQYESDLPTWLESQKESSCKLIPFPERWVIHPMFCEDNQYWTQADAILKSGKATTYIFGPLLKAMNAFSPNMGTIVQSREYHTYTRGCYHLLGDVFLVIKEQDLPVQKSEMLTKEQYDRMMNGNDEEEDEDEAGSE